MAYKVLETFKEKHDNDRIYEAEHPYPADNFKPTKKRLKELSTNQNDYGRPFIEEVDDDDEEYEVENEVVEEDADNDTK